MALTKTPVQVNFMRGLDTKSDPNQVQVGNFLGLTNSVFTTTGRLTKRNGFANITTLPNTVQTNITTLNDNLIATGSNLYAYSADNKVWLNEGITQPIQLSVSSVVRSSTSQTSADAVISPSGIACITYLDNGAAVYKLVDSVTGQSIVNQTALPTGSNKPKAFLVGKYFVITFLTLVSGSTHLRYIAIPLSNTAMPTIPVDLATDVTSFTAPYDGYVANETLYVGYKAGTGTVTVKANLLTSTLIVGTPVTVDTTFTDGVISVTADVSQSTPVIWVTFFDSGTTEVITRPFNQALIPIDTAIIVDSVSAVSEITTVADNSLLTIVSQVPNTYASPYPTSGVRSDYLRKVIVTQSGTASAAIDFLRSVGLASKAFIAENGMIYMLAAYGDTAAPTLSNQPSYFLIDINGNVYMRLAYSNGGGYEVNDVLPNVTILNGTYFIPYLITDALVTVNKGTNLPAGSPVNQILTQTGINLAKFTINDTQQYSSEIASALHLTGGQLWEYDGVRPVEHGFQVWPENVANVTATTGGDLTAQTYFYSFTYEWTDNQGLLHRSAPSIPLQVITTGSTSANTLYVPTLRLTYKIGPNPVRIVGYRWSTAQQVYYQFTSVLNPVQNDTTVDYVTITDTLSDAAILGQTILYTTGGVIEDIAAPASIASALFKNRLFLIDAEDRNTIWYSKQVIQNVPVEMSDLFTIYVAPTTGTQGSTGPCTALSAMDDKLIIFKANAIYYVTGTGPDNTGANNDFSDAIFISAAVGCDNPNSIVLTPSGLMFQSDKGIWLLGRDLSTNYIGAPVELYNGQTVKSAQVIPGTTQVRFILDNGITLMYDYYFQQWGTFTNIKAISATLWQGLHSYLNQFGQIYQETPNTYVDGAQPVLMSFETSWMNLAGLRGFERFYFMFLLGTYMSPFKINMGISYDYNPNDQQSIIISPDNYAKNWGDEAVWGAPGNWGGPGNSFQVRIFPKRQKCETFKLTFQEIYDASLGIAPGQGLSLSGMNIIIGAKKGFSTQKASRSFG